ncbi:putative deacetylase LmbE-like domain-containing protein [Aspergillus californicus]
MRLFIVSTLLAILAPALSQILNIVAHQDDDLLFLSPDLLHYIQAGQAVRTIFITAGDAGRDASYWQGREAGARAAYALMSDAPDAWTEKDAGIPRHEVSLFALNQDPNISLAFLRLPDGHLQGQGFETTGSVSLQKLWEGNISSIPTVSGSGSYTKNELLSTLVDLIAEFGPERVNTLDYVHSYGDGDHSDHHTAAFFVAEALNIYDGSPVLTGYMGYTVTEQPANIVGADLLAKQYAYYAYGRSDISVCSSYLACEGDNYYPHWLQREYTVDATPVANAGSAKVVGFNTVVALDGSKSSDPEGRSLTYEWMQVSGAPVNLIDVKTSYPSFTTPNNPDNLVFELVVRNGQTSSSPAVVTVKNMKHPENIALKAKVTASSANTGSNQTSDKAIDGSAGGFPAVHAQEWVTTGGKAGSWLSLAWEDPQMVSRIALYDRPNLNDQVIGGMIEFDDGERLDIGELSNYGTAKSFDMLDKTVHNLTVRITSVSPSTTNVGLSEVQVYGTSV